MFLLKADSDVMSVFTIEKIGLESVISSILLIIFAIWFVIEFKK